MCRCVAGPNIVRFFNDNVEKISHELPTTKEAGNQRLEFVAAQAAGEGMVSRTSAVRTTRRVYAKLWSATKKLASDTDHARRTSARANATAESNRAEKQPSLIPHAKAATSTISDTHSGQNQSERRPKTCRLNNSRSRPTKTKAKKQHGETNAPEGDARVRPCIEYTPPPQHTCPRIQLKAILACPSSRCVELP